MSDAWVYIGRTTKPSRHWPNVGSVVCAIVYKPERAQETAQAVGKWIRDGLAIECVPVEWIREHFGTTMPYQPSRDATPAASAPAAKKETA